MASSILWAWGGQARTTSPGQRPSYKFHIDGTRFGNGLIWGQRAGLNGWEMEARRGEARLGGRACERSPRPAAACAMRCGAAAEGPPGPARTVYIWCASARDAVPEAARARRAGVAAHEPECAAGRTRAR